MAAAEPEHNPIPTYGTSISIRGSNVSLARIIPTKAHNNIIKTTFGLQSS